MKKIFLLLFLAFVSLNNINASQKSDTTYIAKSNKIIAYEIDNSLEVFSFKDGLLLKYNVESEKFSMYATKTDKERIDDKIDQDGSKAEKLIKFLINKSSDEVINKYQGLSKYNCNDIELFRILTESQRQNTSSKELTEKTKLKGGEMYIRTTQGEHKCSYHLYVPSDYRKKSADEMPLIIAFSPGGSGEGIMKNLKFAAEENNSLLIGCDYLRNGISDYYLEVEVENEILADIYKLITFNKDKLIYSGFSGGAMRSYGLAVRRSEKVYGILAMGGWLGGPDYQQEDYPSNMRIAMANGSEDRAANGWQPIDTKTLEKCGSIVKSFPFTGKHQAASEAIINDALKWILGE